MAKLIHFLTYGTPFGDLRIPFSYLPIVAEFMRYIKKNCDLHQSLYNPLFITCTMKKINVKYVQNLHNEALRGLQFYKEEMNILQQRLEEITKDNTYIEVMRNVEHFQNQLIIQRNNMDELRHTINEHLSLIAHQLEKTSYFVSENSEEAQTKLYEQYLSLEKSINELRHEFNRFAAKWM